MPPCVKHGCTCSDEILRKGRDKCIDKCQCDKFSCVALSQFVASFTLISYKQAVVCQKWSKPAEILAESQQTMGVANREAAWIDGCLFGLIEQLLKAVVHTPMA